MSDGTTQIPEPRLLSWSHSDIHRLAIRVHGCEVSLRTTHWTIIWGVVVSFAVIAISFTPTYFGMANKPGGMQGLFWLIGGTTAVVVLAISSLAYRRATRRGPWIHIDLEKRVIHVALADRGFGFDEVEHLRYVDCYRRNGRSYYLREIQLVDTNGACHLVVPSLHDLEAIARRIADLADIPFRGYEFEERVD